MLMRVRLSAHAFVATTLSATETELLREVYASPYILVGCAIKQAATVTKIMMIDTIPSGALANLHHISHRMRTAQIKTREVIVKPMWLYLSMFV